MSAGMNTLGGNKSVNLSNPETAEGTRNFISKTQDGNVAMRKSQN